MASRRALLLLDGLDEGGALRVEIERHVAEVLAPQGHVMLVTSRPAGLDKERFVGFRQLTLAPLTEAQQEAAVVQRVGSKSDALLAYLRDKVPTDTETGLRVTSNPLMLSMIASVFEIRQGVDMPSTIAELYADASNAMLARGGAMSDQLRALLQRIFFEAHVAQVHSTRGTLAIHLLHRPLRHSMPLFSHSLTNPRVGFECFGLQRRVIEDRQLGEAALGLGAPEALHKLRERAQNEFRGKLDGEPLTPYEGRAEMGHYVEVVQGDYAGKRGMITTDDKSGNQYKVTFADGQVSGWLEPDKLKSSGLDETALLGRSMAVCAEEVRVACETKLSQELRDALKEIRDRVANDQLPLLSLLQMEPLQLQSSHLSFQEYFAARALCEEGTVLSGAQPWQWPAWWANAVALGAEMGGRFRRGLLRAAGVTGDTLDLSQKLGGDRPTVRRAIAAMVASSAELRTVIPIAVSLGPIVPPPLLHCVATIDPPTRSAAHVD